MASTASRLQAELVAQRLLHFLEFVLAQHAVVHEDAGQPRLALGVAQRAIDQHRRDRRIHAARKRADRASAADLLLDLLDGRIDEALRRPCRLRAADLKDEVAQHLRALRRVVHLGMELHRVPFLRGILNAGHGVVRLRHQLEARRQFERFVAVRHPDRKFFGQSLKQN